MVYKKKASIHDLIIKNDISTLQSLLQYDAQTYLSDVTWNASTPLHTAAQNGNLDALKLLLDYKANVHAKAENGNTPLHRAACNGSRRIILELLRRGAEVNAIDRCGDTPLHKASYWNNSDAVRVLAQNGADIEAKNDFGRRPLHVAAGQDAVVAVNALIDHGAEVDARDEEGQTPVFMPAIWNRTGSLKALLVRGAAVDAVNYNGRSVLERAALTGKVDSVRVLLAFGASNYAVRLPKRLRDVESEIQSDCGIMDDRLEAYKKVRWGKKRKILSYARTGRLKLLRQLLDENERLKKLEPDCLQEASRWGHVGVVEYLVRERNMMTKSPESLSAALHEAARRGHFKVLQVLLSINSVDASAPFAGTTPLHQAAKWGKWPSCSLLLQHGASVSVRNRNGLTAVDIARQDGWKETIKVLEQGVLIFKNEGERNSSRGL